MKTTLLSIAFLLATPVEARLYAIDPDPTAATAVDFEKRAVVQIAPAFEELGRSCTAIQIEDKILLMAGHCVGFLRKQAAIPTWRKPGVSSFKITEKVRQPPISKEGLPDEEVDAGHDLGLVLIQPKNCGSLNSNEKFTLPLSETEDSVPVDNKYQLAAYGSSGIHFLGVHTDEKTKIQTAKFGPNEATNQLQTVHGEVFECKKQAVECKKTQEMIDAFKQPSTTITTVAKRTFEIIETPIVRELTVKLQGTLFMEGDSGAVLIQKDKSGKHLITGVLSDVAINDFNKKSITIRREGEDPLEIPIQEANLSWLDASKPALDFDSVKTAIKERKLEPGTFEISRSYELNAINFFSSLSDPANREWLQKNIEDLRKKRDEKYGCDRAPASKK